MTDAMSTSAQAAPWVLLIMAISATYLWRGMGAVIAARIDPESEFLQWIACVAYGLLAGLISRIIFLPVGLLDNTELVDRLWARRSVWVWYCFVIFKRNIAVGTFERSRAFHACLYGCVLKVSCPHEKVFLCVLGLSCVVAFFVLIGGEAKAQECSAPAPVCAAKASVVKIASFEPIGSAVIINDGVLVTNRHMVADNQHVELTLPDGAKF